jgi:hypothetical protein
MKLLLTGATVAAFLVTPALADHPRYWVDQVRGQQVFNVTDTPVGRVERYVDVRGTPGVVIAANGNFGGRRIIAPADDLGARAKGGLLLVLSDSSVNKLPTYRPRYLPFW